jgi:hypothetical protein
MKADSRAPVSLLVISLFWSFTLVTVAQSIPLAIHPSGPKVELSWPAAVTNATQSVYPEYEVQYSTDLATWKPVGGKLRGFEGLSGPLLKLSLDKQPGPVFYRVKADPGTQTQNETGSGGAEVFGYSDAFNTEIQRLGRLSVEDFATNGAPIPYLSQLSWDPTTAQFWTNFYSTNVFSLKYSVQYQPVWLSYNYRLNTNEFGVFQTNGFVVSERLASPTFGDAYYRLFNADLPVFVTADSVLHAWHRTYQSMLQELEELELSTLLSDLLTNLSSPLPQVWQQYGQGPLQRSILDVDLFLTVARSLWAGQQVPSQLGAAGVEQQVTTLLSAISGQLLQEVTLFGTNRVVDFSQFKVRGHYDASDRLRNYFRTMMWCGRFDFRLKTFWPNQEDDIRQLGAAVVLSDLLQRSGQFTNWSVLEEVVRTFVGPTDSMTFAQLGDLLTAAGIGSGADVPDLLTLTNLQTRLLTGELGVQSIHSDFLYSPLSPEQVKLPRSFTLCGQKFVLDSWALSQVVFDRVLWAPDDPPRILFGKVIRRKPSCLDVAYSTFGNDQIVPELVTRILNTNGVAFRDGLPYQHNLLAVRNVMDGQGTGVWTNNIYTAWLAALRALSAPTTDPKYPEAMRTRAWAMKTLNTQLASWAELRHDTLLYAKPSYTEPLACSYPAGFVEPRPEFWQAMGRMADLTARAIMRLPLSGQVTVITLRYGFPTPITLDLGKIRSGQASFLSAFSQTMGTLQTMAEKELAQQPFSASETDMLKNVVELAYTYYGERQWNGWYPGLFYTNSIGSVSGLPKPGCDLWDPVIADVHTDLPDDVVGDPGAVIHEATGSVHTMLIAVDNGPDRTVYAGPVLSHYELEVPGVNRLSDSDWQSRLNSAEKPDSPEWTRSYLVPGQFTLPASYP